MPDTTTGTLDDTLVSQGCFQVEEDTIVVQGFVGLLSLSIGLPHYAGEMFPASGFDVHSQELVSSYRNPDNETIWLTDSQAGWLTGGLFPNELGGLCCLGPGLADWLAD